MLQYEDGHIMSKCQQKTTEGDLVWTFAKSPGEAGGLLGAAEIFAEHGYEIVEWDDSVEVFDSQKTIELERKRKKKLDTQAFTDGEEGEKI